MTFLPYKIKTPNKSRQTPDQMLIKDSWIHNNERFSSVGNKALFWMLGKVKIRFCGNVIGTEEFLYTETLSL